MKLPEVENPKKYVGLYVVDFGDSCAVGFIAQEVAEILESEKYPDVAVYKIHNAKPNGTMELKGIPNQTFQLEAGMFFYADSRDKADDDYTRLTELAENILSPCRAKVHLSKLADELFVTAIIYPAEYDDEVSAWLLDANYRTAGVARGGCGAVQNYYESVPKIIKSKQLFGIDSYPARTGRELFGALKKAVQR